MGSSAGCVSVRPVALGALSSEVSGSLSWADFDYGGILSLAHLVLLPALPLVLFVRPLTVAPPSFSIGLLAGLLLWGLLCRSVLF